VSVYGDTLSTGRDSRFLNVLLIIAGIVLVAWTISVWMGPTVAPYQTSRPRAVKKADSGVRRARSMASYSIVVNKDIFRASRARYMGAREPVAARQALRTNSAGQVPSLTLLGTVILNESRAAIISLRGREKDAKFYKVGDTIGNFTLTEIGKDAVSLRSGGKALRLPLSRPKETAGRNKLMRQFPSSR